MKYLFYALSLFLILASCQPQIEPTTLIIVRHAEKLSVGDNPALTPVGQARAERLSQMLERQSVSAVYSTPYNRTRLTGVPTASGNSLEVLEYDPSDPESFLAEVLGKHSGQTVLITGHSNTVPAMVNLLTGSSLENFEDSDYGNLFVITGSALGSCSSVNLFY
ncbi:MAG: phosphoglycerate mutase family protein [Cyclobacteriaceae bacterium]